jgi:hypothetical protein
MNDFFSLFGMFISCLFSFFNSCKNVETELHCLNISYSIPLIDRDGSLIENRDYFNIYFFENLTLFEFRNKFDSVDKDGLIKKGILNSYFAFEKGSKQGIIYDSPPGSKNDSKLSVDSMLRKRALKSMQWDKILNLKLVKSSYDNSHDVLEEVYGNQKIEKGNRDTIRLYYSKKLMTYDYTFSRELDSLKKMKLFKIRLQYEETYSKEYKITFPKRETYFEMQEIPVGDSKKVIGYFNRFKRNI